MGIIDDYFDKIYCVNLDERTDRWEQAKKEFTKLKNCTFYPDLNNACINADIIILHTEWDEFKSLDFNKLVKKKNFIIYDLRNLYSIEEMRRKKIKYFSIGRP